MDNFNSDKSKLAYRHLIERKSMLVSEVQAWHELRIRHKQAIQKVGLLNFTAWNQQKEEIQELSLKLILARTEMRDRQKNELDK